MWHADRTRGSWCELKTKPRFLLAPATFQRPKIPEDWRKAQGQFSCQNPHMRPTQMITTFTKKKKSNAAECMAMFSQHKNVWMRRKCGVMHSAENISGLCPSTDLSAEATDCYSTLTSRHSASWERLNVFIHINYSRCTPQFTEGKT